MRSTAFVEDTVEAWTNPVGASIPRTWVFGSKKSVGAEGAIGIGSPFYGRGYNGSNQGTAIAYRDLAGLPSADGNAFQVGGANIWIPGKALLANRVKYAHEHGLQHIIFWEMWHALPPSHADSLLRTAYETCAALAAAEGDFNADGFVDGADLDAWRQHFGETTGVTGAMGDANADGAVDGTDFLVWQRGLSAPPLAGGALVAAPEPSLALLLAMSWGGTVLLWRLQALNSSPGRLR